MENNLKGIENYFELTGGSVIEGLSYQESTALYEVHVFKQMLAHKKTVWQKETILTSSEVQTNY